MSDEPAGESVDWRRRAEAAERTVEILKRKVIELYGGDDASGLQRQLEAAQRRAERTLRQRELAEVRAEELRRYTAHLEAEVERRTRAIRTILDHVTCGFLLVNRDLELADDPTRSCRALFGQEVRAGSRLPVLLGIAGTLRETELWLAVDQVFEDVLPEEVAVGQLPRRFVVGPRVLALDAGVVRDAGGAVAHLLLTVQDVTDLEAARETARHHERLVHILQQGHAFRQFVEDSRESLAIAARCVGEDQGVARRALHTVKGNAAAFDLETVVAAAHCAEGSPTVDAAALAVVQAAMDTFLRTNEHVLGRAWQASAGAVYPVTAAGLAALQRAIAERDMDGLRAWCDDVVRRPAGELAAPLNGLVERLAARLGKDVTLEVVGADVEVDAELLRPVFGALPHLIRNAVDHGIEEPGERGGKPPVGRVVVAFASGPQGWIITVSDDGGGVDVASLCSRAVELGLETVGSLERMTAEERLALVFRDGLSSRGTSTSISGRGVGLAAVHAVVGERGGDVEVASTPGVGTRVALRVPVRHPS